jgi:uncharacterized protein
LIYLDTSAIAPFYWAEALSGAIEALLREETTPALSQLAEVELFSALSRWVRMREIETEAAREIANRFQDDLKQGFYTRMEVEPIHYNLARDWIGQFDTPLRTLDALHLAIASAHEIRLVTADGGFAESARRVGVEVQTLVEVAHDFG